MNEESLLGQIEKATEELKALHMREKDLISRRNMLIMEEVRYGSPYRRVAQAAKVKPSAIAIMAKRALSELEGKK